MPEVKSFDFVVQEATPEDAEGIINVQYKTWLSTYPKVAPDFVDEKAIHAKFHNLEEKINHTCERISKKDPKEILQLVARTGEEIIGFSIAKRNLEKPSEILALYVLEDFQGHGIGGQLMGQSLRWLGADENRVNLHVVEGNSSSISFYERHGFTISKKLPPSENPPEGIYMPEIEMSRPPSPVE